MNVLTVGGLYSPLEEWKQNNTPRVGNCGGGTREK